MSEREGAKNPEGDMEGPPSTRDVGLGSESGEQVRDEDLMRALLTSTSRGPRPPALEGTCLSRKRGNRF